MKDRLVFDPSAADETDNVGSYLRSADGTLITHTDVSGKKSLDVNVANEVDIRDLEFETDKVDASGSVVALDAATLTALENITVSASDLDIRDLSHAQDSVKIGDGVDFLAINADGSINVNADISVVNGHEKVEDVAHASGDIGSYILGVRQDTLANSTSTDGDYASFKMNSLGALYVEVAKSAVPTHTSWLNTQNTVDTTAELVVASDLAGRKKLLIQNISTSGKTIYLGSTNAVTAADGIRLSAGSSVELELAAGVAIYAISSASGADLRIAQMA